MTLENTLIYNELVRRNTDSSKYYTHQIKQVYSDAKSILERVITVFHNYTKHDITHSINVMENMANFINSLDSYSDLELCILCMSAITHDLGMFVSDSDIEQIKNDQSIIGTRKFSKVMSIVEDERVALEECIRPYHAARSEEVMKDLLLKDKPKIFLVYETQHSYFDYLCKINLSHNESINWIKENLDSEKTIGTQSFNSQFIALILRLSDLLDIDDRRTPLIIRDHLNLPFTSIKEWSKHKIITNYDKIAQNEKLEMKYVFFDGETSDPNTYRNLLSYIDYFEEQLRETIKFCQNEFNKLEYQLHFESDITNRIKTNGFSVANFKLNLNYNAITKLLMGENIYGSRKYGIRELIQNSLDACSLMEAMIKEEEHEYEPPEIRIIWDEKNNELIVRDTGIGMTEPILKNYFLNIGLSYYRSDDFLFSDTGMNPIGNYGIGFLSCFMLSDDVKIKTRHYSDNQEINVSLNRNSEYIVLSKKNEIKSHGTSIILNLESVKSVFANAKSMGEFISQNFIEPKYTMSLAFNNNQTHQYVDLNFMKIKSISTDENWIDLSNYFNDVTVIAKFRKKQLLSYKSLYDINKTAYCVIENECGNIVISNVTEVSDISEYILSGKLTCLNIPLITGLNMDDALLYTDDFDVALEYVEHEIICVYFKEEDVFHQVRIDDHSDYVFESKNNPDSQISLSEVYDWHKTKSEFDGEIEINSQTINLIELNSEYMQFVSSTDNYYLRKYFGISTSGYKQGVQLFVKNIKISNFSFDLPPMLHDIELDEVIINSNNRLIIPSISRNDLNIECSELLSFSIRKAILLYLLDNTDHKDLVNEFIKLYYSKSSDLLVERP